MRRLLRRVHAWTGLAISLLLLSFAVTGGALVYKEAYWRLVHPELRVSAPVLGPSDHAAAIAAAWSDFGGRIRSIKLPEPGVPAYHLYLDGGEAFLSATDHRVIDHWRPDERVMGFLFDLHAHLMAGEAGERVGGVIALLAVVLAASGLVLWWPARRRFAAAHLLPRDLSRRGLLLWHRDLGALASPVLLVLLLTGSGLVFYNTARTLLNGVLGDAVPVTTPPEGEPGAPFSLPDAAMISRVESAFPGARIVFYRPPRDGIHEFRLKQPCELHPNGRSYVYLDAAGSIVQEIDACAMPPGERAAQAFYPLHAGKSGSAVYKLVVFLGALALAGLSLSGALSYLRKLRRPRER
ncbi:MAG TPA: PepSY-associated TM helix domain-containing protein [Longimicrobiaceae bacterium]|nr:PepSY-associated TM helix domain-containing protein [Longimicrobiaceae bacterium]